MEIGIDRVFRDGATGTKAGRGDGVGEITMRRDEMGAWRAGAARTRGDLGIAAFSERMEVLDGRNHIGCMGKMWDKDSRKGDRRTNEQREKEKHNNRSKEDQSQPGICSAEEECTQGTSSSGLLFSPIPRLQRSHDISNNYIRKGQVSSSNKY